MCRFVVPFPLWGLPINYRWQCKFSDGSSSHYSMCPKRVQESSFTASLNSFYPLGRCSSFKELNFYGARIALYSQKQSSAVFGICRARLMYTYHSYQSVGPLCSLLFHVLGCNKVTKSTVHFGFSLWEIDKRHSRFVLDKRQNVGGPS